MSNEVEKAWKRSSILYFQGFVVLLAIGGVFFIYIGGFFASLGGAIIGGAASLAATMFLEKMELTTHVKAYECRLEDVVERVSRMAAPAILSRPEQLVDLCLKPGESLYHYSRVDHNAQPLWQEAQLNFLRMSPTICCCDAHWDAPNGVKVPYRVELGVRGRRVVLAITVATGEKEEPTIEVYPSMFRPGEEHIAGLAIDDTWEPRRQLIEPTLLARRRLITKDQIGGLCTVDESASLDAIWRAKFDYASFLPSTSSTDGCCQPAKKEVRTPQSRTAT